MTTASISLSNEQRRVLAEMGLDVWIRRGVVKASSVAAARPLDVPRGELPAIVERRAEPQTSSAARTSAARTSVAGTSAATADLQVALECIAAAGVVAIGEFSNPLDRRLAHDIVLAIVGATAEAQRSAFRWPQTVMGDSTPAAARSAYRGFLRGQIERAEARLLLLLGPGAELLFDAEFDAAGVEVLRCADVPALRADPLAKKRLWLSVSRHIRA